ncbi:hypothetical protein NQU96_11835 [Pseudoalteromonas elyakovii]|nr:hypothetical protein [Pseudoalteromonas elyakovii]
MANYQDYQNFTINPRKQAYSEVDRIRPIKPEDQRKCRIRRDVEAYHQQRAIDREYCLEYLWDEQS